VQNRTKNRIFSAFPRIFPFFRIKTEDLPGSLFHRRRSFMPFTPADKAMLEGYVRAARPFTDMFSVKDKTALVT
jgi:hypothetical protein